MDPLSLALGCLAGAGAATATAWLLRKKAKPAPEAHPRTRLYDLANSFTPTYQASARPEDLLDLQGFQDGVRLLSGPPFTVDDLIGYLGGDNSVVTTMSARALTQRGDAEERAGQILDRLHEVSLYAAAHLLPLFERSQDPHVPVKLLLRIATHWQNPLGQRLLRAYLQGRVAPDAVAHFRADLRRLEADHAKFLREVVAVLEGEGAEALRLALAEDSAGSVDTALLRTIGIVHEAGEPQPLLLEAPAQDGALEELQHALVHNPGRSLLLVGEQGVGKRTVTRRLVQRLAADGWTVFEAGAMHILAGQSYIGELEQRLTDLLKAISGKPKVLWLVPDLPDLALAGRHKHQRASILDQMLPHLAAGRVRMLSVLVPPAHEQLVRAQPQLRNATVVVRLAPADAAGALDLAERFVAALGADASPALCDAALLRDIQQRVPLCVGNLAPPGAILHFLKLLHEHVRGSGAASRSASVDDVIALASKMTGLPAAVLDEREGLDLAALRKHFEKRVLGQPEAISCLVDCIAMLKSGLNDPRRPLGVFLFTGPTGTGKTEIARTLAGFLFGSEEGMVRIDMSELQHAEGVERLVGDDDEHSGRKALVHRIREQPFAVVLFDEIEKAHPAVFDLFLQLFDEGRLADRRGVPADFRHTLIILTSNVGVRSLEGSSLGFGGKRPDLLRALEGTFRRELLNRIDRIVAFRPLDRAVMRQVLKKELDLVLARRGFAHRPWVIEWDEQALEFLLEEGFTPELGARPLRRAIERHLLAPLATAIVAKEAPEGEQFLFVGMKGHKLTVEFVSPDGDGGGPDVPEPRARGAAENGSRPKLVDVVREGSGAPAEVFVVAEHLARLRATIEHDGWHRRQTDALAAMGVDDFWRSPTRFSVLGRVELMDRMARHLATSTAQAQQLWGKAPSDAASYSAKATRALAERVWLLEAALQSLDENEPQDAFLAVRAITEGRADKALVGAFARELAAMYRAWAERRGMEWTTLAESAAGAQPFEGVYAVSGLAALRLLAPEDGLHAEKRDDRPGLSLHVRVLVVAQPDGPAPADPKAALEAARRALLVSAGRQPAPVRSYRRGAAEEARDRRRGYRTGRLDRVLAGEFDVM